MRNTVVYILRLLVDESEPEGLHGVLRNVASGVEHTFSSEQGLLELLHHPPAHPPGTTKDDQATQPPSAELGNP